MHNITLENLVKMAEMPHKEISEKVPVVVTPNYYRKISIVDLNNKKFDFILSKWEYDIYKDATY